MEQERYYGWGINKNSRDFEETSMERIESKGGRMETKFATLGEKI